MLRVDAQRDNARGGGGRLMQRGKQAIKSSGVVVRLLAIVGMIGVTIGRLDSAIGPPGMKAALSVGGMELSESCEI